MLFCPVHCRFTFERNYTGPVVLTRNYRYRWTGPGVTGYNGTVEMNGNGCHLNKNPSNAALNRTIWTRPHYLNFRASSGFGNWALAFIASNQKGPRPNFKQMLGITFLRKEKASLGLIRGVAKARWLIELTGTCWSPSLLQLNSRV